SGVRLRSHPGACILYGAPPRQHPFPGREAQVTSGVPTGSPEKDSEPQSRRRRMRVAVFTTFAASRKEPLAQTLSRMHEGCVAAGLGEPAVGFVLSDATGLASGPLALAGLKRVSSVDRVLKRWPQLHEFERTVTGPATGQGATRVITNVSTDGQVKPLP